MQATRPADAPIVRSIPLDRIANITPKARIPLTASPESSVSRLFTVKKLGCATPMIMTIAISTSQIEFCDRNFFLSNVLCIPFTLLSYCSSAAGW